MMNLDDLMKAIDFPDEARAYFLSCYDRLLQKPQLYQNLLKIMDSFFLEEGEDYIRSLDQVAADLDIPNYSAYMLFLLLSTKPLRYLYKYAEIPESIYLDTLKDLSYKLKECKTVYGIWGTFVLGWFKGFFNLKRFQLGRLQYEWIDFQEDRYERGTVSLKKGDRILNCHIPSSGPLTREAVLDSLAKAYAFYKEDLNSSVMPVVCSSWLLYPQHYEVYPQGSNLRDFYDAFDIVKEQADPANNDFWRVFGVYYKDDKALWPQATTLQRRFGQYIGQGKTMGWGRGLLLYDGEKECLL